MMINPTHISGGWAPSLAFQAISACLLIMLLGCSDQAIAEIDSEFQSLIYHEWRPLKRPDLYPPVFTVEHNVPDKLSPGYIFLGPYEADNSGPYIYDTEGNLVWSGWGNSGPGNAHGMHVCNYKDTNHLCFFQGVQQNGYCRGHGVIMDNRYRIVKTVVPGGGIASSDMHEFKLMNGGETALMTVYQQRQFDMSLWNVRTGMGWLMESIFQEIDVETNKVLFEWRSLDHVDPSDSYTYPAHTDTSGTGLEPRSPWDYFHINSVDKNKDGDYLISSRHTSCIYKISGKDGSILWRLHGAHPSFKNINFSFSQQHDARWLSENSTHTLLSLYNNGYNGYNQTHDFSSGMIILIDHVAKTATQVREYKPFDEEMISSSQGNLQVLPNRNAFIGWGNNAYISEHDEQGNLLFWGYIDKDRIMNYRALKFEWEGNPTDVPALWTYAKSPDAMSPTTFYVSWNGATRVKYWRFYGSDNPTGPYTLLRQIRKNGFETTYTNQTFYLWSYAEAVDKQGAVLGTSRKQFTFTPPADMQGYCADSFCANAPAFGLPGEEEPQPFIPSVGINSVPWVDPKHPASHNNLGQPGAPAPSSSPSAGSKATYGKAGWVVPVLLVGGVTIGIFVILRVYRRKPQRQRDRASSEVANGTNDQKISPDAARLPWWNWRRWIDAPNDPPHYFPLSEPRTQRHGSDV